MHEYDACHGIAQNTSRADGQQAEAKKNGNAGRVASEREQGRGNQQVLDRLRAELTKLYSLGQNKQSMRPVCRETGLRTAPTMPQG